MSKLGKKLLGIMLAASLAITSAFPMQGVAAEKNGSEYQGAEDEDSMPAEEGQTLEELVQPTGDEAEGQPEAEEGQQPTGEAAEGQPEAEEGQQPTGDAAEGSVPEAAEESQQPARESQTLEGAGQSQFPEGTKDSQTHQAEHTEGNAQPSGEDPANSAGQQVFMLPQSDSSGETDSLDGDGSYDINQPVIESFELEENGQTLTTDQYLHFKIRVFDSDSNVKSISVNINGGYYYHSLEFEPGDEENVYTATVPCTQFGTGSFYVGSIRVEDEKSNYVDGDVTGEDGGYLYRFTIEYKPQEGNVTLSDLKMQINASDSNGTLKAGDSVTYTANVQCEGLEATGGRMGITYGGYHTNKEGFGASYDQSTGLLSGTFTIGERTYPEEWRLYSIEVFTKSSGTFHFLASDIAPDAELKFTVDQAYDKEPPVIESIDIGENGREVQAGETVEIRIKVTEDHPRDSAQARFDPFEVSQSSQSVDLDYDSETGEYVGQVQITEFTYPCKWQLGYLSILDIYGNRASLSDFKGDGQEDCSRYYTVSPDGYDTVKPAITKISIEPSEKPVKRGDTVTLKVEAEEKNPDGGYAYFAPAGSEYKYTKYVSLSYSKDQNAYIGSVEIGASTDPGQWELTELSICDKNNNAADLSEYGGQGPWGFTVDESGYDIYGPVIESISLEKNGEFVRPGDTLGITIKVNEKNPAYNAYAYFYPQVANVSSSICVDLEYNHAEREYVGSIPITDSTYPCEWALARLEMEDTLRHSYSMSEELSGWQTAYPWYFKVKSGNTYREDVKNAVFSFYGLQQQEDGSYWFGYSEQEMEHVGRRSTLKELGIFPEPIEGVTATWIRSWGALEVKEDTELLLNSHNYFTASYDKGCANVSLTYVSGESGEKTVMLPVFTDKEATYREVLAALELPEDARTDDFAEMVLSYSDNSHNWDSKVGDIANISAIADYRNCQVTWNARYIGQDGNETSRIITGSYQEGTTAAEALAGLDSPEDTLGMEGEGWALLGADGEQALSKEMVSFDIVALYRGNTTLDVSYTYRSEDGTIAGGSKLLAMEGEDLSDAEIQGEATNAFKDANHFPGLRVSEWEGTVELDQGKYKKIQFQAQYYNCVVALKYPDETCQYVVVDKNTEFTLPIENETYTDILWEGFAQGQAVTITEDREFLAAEAKRKDGTEEKPSGGRLTADEIAKIKEEIEKAEAGASVKIDMKKATVVPKEVLEAIKGKPVDIVLDMGSYSWTIDGAEVNAADLKDIDLEVSIGTDNVPSALVSSIAEGKPATQLSLTHNGEFGFRADLTLNLGSENSGSYGNLYYYDSSGKLIFRNAGQIGADGSTTLSFSHASDYVAIIDKMAHTSAGSGSGKEPAGGTDSGVKAEPDSSANEEGPGTGTGSEETLPGNPGGSTDNDSPGRTDASLRDQDGKEPEARNGKDARKNGEEQLTATVKKRTGSVTAGSGSAGTAAQTSLKSPKTGEPDTQPQTGTQPDGSNRMPIVR